MRPLFGSRCFNVVLALLMLSVSHSEAPVSVVYPTGPSVNSILSAATSRLPDAHRRQLMCADQLGMCKVSCQNKVQVNTCDTETLHWECVCKSDAQAPFKDWQFPIPFQLCRQHYLTCLHSCQVTATSENPNNQTQHSMNTKKRNFNDYSKGCDLDHKQECPLTTLENPGQWQYQQQPQQQQQRKIILRRQVVNSNGVTTAFSRRVVNQRQHTNLHQHEEYPKQQKCQQSQNKDISLHNSKKHQKHHDGVHCSRTDKKQKKKDKERGQEEKNMQVQTDLLPVHKKKSKARGKENKTRDTTYKSQTSKGQEKGDLTPQAANIKRVDNGKNNVVNNNDWQLREESSGESYWSLSVSDSGQERDHVCVTHCRKMYPCGTPMAPAYHDLTEYLKDSVVDSPSKTKTSAASKEYAVIVTFGVVKGIRGCALSWSLITGALLLY